MGGENKPASELLERRMLLSAALDGVTGLLTVHGTSVGDQVALSISGSQLVVLDAGVSLNFTKSAVKNINIDLADGPGQVSIASAIKTSVSITAGSGADTLIAGSGRTTFFFGSVAASAATPTADVISPSSGLNALDFSGVPADDSVTVDLTSDAALASFGDISVQTRSAGQASDFTTVVGSAGQDTITGNAANDRLDSGAGTATLVPGSGNDTLVGSGSQTDYVFNPQSTPTTYIIDQKKRGQNLLDFSALPTAVSVNLLNDLMASYTNVQIHDELPGQAARINQVYGGQGEDSITGNNSGDTILGGSGNETINGGTGADFIYLGGGNDSVSGQGGADTIFGGAGSDVIYATNANTGASPGALAKPGVTIPGAQIYAGSGDIQMFGGPGNDSLVGGAGNDTTHGLGGNDYIIGGDQISLLFGDAGNDTIYAGQGDTTISGGAGNNTIYGGTVGGTSTFIDSNLVDDPTLIPSTINPAALTAAAIAADQPATPPIKTPSNSPGSGDIVVGGASDTTIIGGSGNDTLRGGDGPSTVVAGSGNDLLIAGYGDDVLQGGPGEDTFAAGGGPDSMTGGTGNDVFLNVNGYADTVTGGSGFNIAQLDPTGLTIYTNIDVFYDPYSSFNGLGETEIAGMTAVVKASTSPHPGPLPPTAPASATLVGGVLHVGTNTYTGAQDITVTDNGNGTVSVFQANVGTQNFALASMHLVSINGGAGDDFIDVHTLNIATTINAGNGNNVVSGGEVSTTITTGTGNDTIFGNFGHNVISGGSGNNIIYGGPGNDLITGGAGSDWIYPTGDGESNINDTESDTINGGTGTEKVDLAGNDDPMTIRLDKGTIVDNATGAVTHISRVRNLWAGSGNDLIVGAPTAGVLLNAGAGNDTVFGISASDVFYGGIGDDNFFSDGSQGFMDLLGDHAVAPGNIDQYNQGTTIIPPSVDSTDIKVALQHFPP